MLLEAQKLCFTTVHARCDAEEFGNAKINEIASRRADSLDISVVLEFGDFFDPDLDSAAG
jgi:hypothetical protein